MFLATALVSGALTAACFLGGDDDDETPTPVPETTLAETPSVAPEPTATPDRLATPPADGSDAVAWLRAALAASNFSPPCPQSLIQYGVACAIGDADGDDKQDFAYLVPLKPRVALAPHPAAVVVRRAATGVLEERSASADVSPVGANVFSLADRTGDSRGDLSYLDNACSAAVCESLPVVLMWDGNSWRNVGPGGEPIGNVDSAGWQGSGANSKLRVHGGKLPDDAPREAGPTRATTLTFGFVGTRYVLELDEPDPPEYLYHAVLDADRVFRDDKRASIAEFEALLQDEALKDWRPPAAPDKDRRPALEGYALFRIALAHAALQSPEAELVSALDAVVNHGVESGELLFVRITDVFRRGYPNGGLHAGCQAVAVYINTVSPDSDTKGYIAAAFSYGYENPPGTSWSEKICPF